ncbi:ABC-type amino acid transport substrate-binding protein [Roseibium hamelinense]|uniref:ABC-type amino acid transport substrate-binding protein n=1 Tax=Roseibium hamelinense TaxID=150831 RepID=A0A562THY0_9HYPH|nr:transporter substrate-binding domain-containing protein [Roseibium hamelinense]MTI42637.1 transporter substrate-binding domain-containing protein [Roseibium hamelinense]TWI93261.1 ABC-type amino acid transport substrate-binding protein [Roseibium hamelinense]
MRSGWYVPRAFAALAILVAAFGVSGAGKDARASSGPLLIAYDVEFRPLTFQNGLGAADGLYIHILKGALDAGGISYRLVPMPWKRIVSETDAAAVDVSLPWRHQPERFEKYHMVGPISESGMPARLWQKTGAGLRWDTYEDLSGMKVGVRAGFTYAPDFQEADNFERVRTFSNEVMIRMLINKRFDIAISDEITLRMAARDLGLEAEIEPVDGPPVDFTLRYFVVPKSKPKIAGQLQSLLDAFKQTGRYRQIIAQYFD